VKKILIKSKVADSILKTIAKNKDGTETLAVLNKALGHKYIRRWPDPKNPKKWRYLYPQDLLHPIKALKNLFGIKDEKVEEDYTKNNIQKNYGADKKTFAFHVLEYFSNKIKWDTFFSKKNNRDSYKKPQSAPKKPVGGGGSASTGTGGTTEDPAGGGKKEKKSIDGKGKKGDNLSVDLNINLMRKVWGMYSGKEGKSDERDNNNAEREKLPADTPAVRAGGGKETGDLNVPGAEIGDQRGEPLQLPLQSGERTGRDVRLTKKQAKDIRQACLDLLKAKKDSEMTEEDKALLRQYEGAGGLGGDDASVHGTLYEYYTPRNVTQKVWEIVDKYIPGKKEVLEPSAGIGRFAEGRALDNFTLNEYDDISSRISGILHPGADIKHGAFQEMFKPGKAYAGKKYDVVIGNPPYGSYEGLWKGRGEGKEHSRYEEYFIDRGLDTLREGGIMAFVVPSSFLRGGNDKIKEKIASKGKLLEAWRLPNGTFNTTGVGTDIIIIRKEKGDPAQFSNNAYFADNPQMVVGTETTKTGKFGKPESYVALNGDDTFDTAIDRIRADLVEAVPLGEKTQVEEAKQKVTVKAEKSEAEKHKNRSEAMKGNDNAAGKHDVDTAAEFNAKYNKHIPAEALPIWKAIQWDGSIDINRIGNTYYLEHSGNYVKDVDGKWYDVAIFASGNIYEKLDHLEGLRKTLSEKEFSEKEYKRQKALLEAALPTPKTVMDFDISPLGVIAEEFKTSERRGMNNAYEVPLRELFVEWIQYGANNEQLALPPDATRSDVIEYVHKQRVSSRRGKTEEEKEANKLERMRTETARREAAERLFNQFIRENLSIEDQKRLADVWNRQQNGTVPVDLDKVPVFLDGISKTFKEKTFVANKSQIKGTSWLGVQGNGIVAFDVGVGKTITALMSTMNDMQMGRCKKPIVFVPKAVKKNWIAEAGQLFPNVKINDLDNFSDISGLKNADGTLNIQEGSITICTYEALPKIGFKPETVNGELKEAFFEAMSSTEEDDSDRDKAKNKESIMTRVGEATRTGENWINWEDAGFDHVTVDEAHNFRNLFNRPKNTDKNSKGKEAANEFKDIPAGGEPSLRALKLFAISQLIQKENNGRNVHLLTATPFQNSPTEIYSMLSYVAREKLKEAGIINFHEFLTRFAELKAENSVDYKGNVKQKNVMKGFKNLQALQSLINQYIMKIDGEDAGIIRPDHKDHDVELTMTAEQRDISEKIRAYLEAGPDPEKDPGATLRCLNALRRATLSPILVDEFMFLDDTAAAMAGIRENMIRVKNRNFVEDSPKMKFVGDSSAAFYKANPKVGQIIHVPQGIEYYPAIKKYLVSQGIPEDAICFMAPKPKGLAPAPKVKGQKTKEEFLPGGDDGNDKKEELKERFNNPNDKLKIIIGSDTIIEGVNLNGNTVPTFECEIPWNPTDTDQLRGRSWRQGNKQGKVHMIFPLMNDSIDSFMYQKHDEKGSRLNTIWNSQENKIDVGGIDPEQIKFSLIKDPKKRADLYIKEKTADLTMKHKIAAATSDKIFAFAGDWNELNDDSQEYQKEIADRRKALEAFNAKTDEQIIEENNLDFTDTRFGEHFYDDYASVSGKTIKEIRDNYNKRVKDDISGYQKSIQRNKGKMETIDNTLKRYGISDPENAIEIEKVRKRFSNEAIKHKAQIAEIEGNRDRFIKEAEAQIKAETKPGNSVDAAVKIYTQKVLEDMYPFEVVEKRQARSKDVLTKSLGGKGKKKVILIKSSVRRSLKF